MNSILRCEEGDASSMPLSAIASTRMWVSSAHADVNCFSSMSALSRASSARADVNSSSMFAMSGVLSALADVNFFSLMSAMQMYHVVPSISNVNVSLRCLLSM